MEKLILIGIGVAALGYFAYIVWSSVNGKGKCNCGSGGSCPNAGKSHSCCSESKV
ncbi:hypothetical protein SDC9_11486 [bioreactor metagenome]|uniref:FeoB-associated Cys-rich membrane protein n=1 Tax=bioreactor metagenome TaxID=1076179 RepID=A0A644THU3_9ZZZZ|nr:FeoB-associated Cys-rich membrane protein [Negativicutes bacterium]